MCFVVEEEDSNDANSDYMMPSTLLANSTDSELVARSSVPRVESGLLSFSATRLSDKQYRNLSEAEVKTAVMFARLQPKKLNPVRCQSHVKTNL